MFAKTSTASPAIQALLAGFTAELARASFWTGATRAGKQDTPNEQLSGAARPVVFARYSHGSKLQIS